ncbi:MAG: SDR family NAD(P)-dependent oxidoreductase [Pseudomonadota bacterium]
MTNTNDTTPRIATTAAQGMDRRSAMRLGTLGAAAVAATAMGRGSAANAQTESGANLELSGKTAFITGGARGIGLATAEELARAGADIVLFDVASGSLPHVSYPISTRADLDAAQARVEALGVRCLAVQGDVRDLEAQRAAMAQGAATLGGIDIVVANAGVSHVGPIEEVESGEITTQFEVNVGGVIKTTQAAVPFLRERGGGRIIYISSGLGRVGNELFPIYTTTKWAVIGFGKSAALSYGRDNIMCNIVAPGLVSDPACRQ